MEVCDLQALSVVLGVHVSSHDVIHCIESVQVADCEFSHVRSGEENRHEACKNSGVDQGIRVKLCFEGNDGFDCVQFVRGSFGGGGRHGLCCLEDCVHLHLVY